MPFVTRRVGLGPQMVQWVSQRTGGAQDTPGGV